MTMELAVDIMRNLLQTALLLSIPILGTALVVGLTVSFVQSITSLQEQTLTFVPKLVCVSLAVVLSANFMLKHLRIFVYRCLI
jgi:flagellar biosynthetic protein FliQ